MSTEVHTSRQARPLILAPRTLIFLSVAGSAGFRTTMSLSVIAHQSLTRDGLCLVDTAVSSPSCPIAFPTYVRFVEFKVVTSGLGTPANHGRFQTIPTNAHNRVCYSVSPTILPYRSSEYAEDRILAATPCSISRGVVLSHTHTASTAYTQLCRLRLTCHALICC